MFTLKLYTGWEQNAEDQGMFKRQIKNIYKFITTCRVEEDTDEYTIYAMADDLNIEGL